MIQENAISVQNFLVSSYLETIKAIDGKIFNISYHQKRYESVLNSLGMQKYKNLLEYLNPPQNGLYRCRVVYSLDEIFVTYHLYKKRDIQTLKLVYNDEIKYELKSTDREYLNTLFELKENCNDIIIVKNGFVTDTTIANIALFQDGIWFTPKEALLKGTTRTRLLDEGKIVEKSISVNDIFHYTQVALLNAMIDFDIIAQKNIRKIIC